MNHQVEDHGDVRAAELEGREALGLQIARLFQIGRRRAHRAVETLHVPHLERHLRRSGRAHERFGALERVRERLFHEQRPAPREHGQAHRRVCGRRHGDRHRPSAVEQRLAGGEGDGLELARHLRRPLDVRVVDPDQLRVGDLTQEPRVVVAERARADDADGQRRSHTRTPRWVASMKRRKYSTSGTRSSSARARTIPWVTVYSELKSSR